MTIAATRAPGRHRFRSGRAGVACRIALAATALIAIVHLVRALTRPFFVETYQASQFWVSYQDAFLRRGLPGELLRVISGGMPTAGGVVAAALVLLVVALASLAVLVAGVVRCIPDPRDRLLAGTLAAVSPFTFALAVEDLGRYDAIGWAGFALVAVLGVRARPAIALVGSAIALVVAALSEEFLAAFLVPLIALVAWRAPWPRASRLVGGAAATLPGGLLAVWTLAHRPSRDALLLATDAAHQIRPDIARSSPVNAISSLTQDLSIAVHHLAAMKPWVMPVVTVVWGACFVVTAGILWLLAGRPRPRLFHALAAWGTVAALGLTITGVDYRRWWAMAFCMLLAALPLLRREPAAPPQIPAQRDPAQQPPPPKDTPTRQTLRPWVPPVVLACLVVGQIVPVAVAINLDPAAQTQVVLDPG